MLEDRDYMRAESYSNHWFDRLPVSLWLVILNAACYAAQLIVPLAGGPHVEPWLALRPDDLLRGCVWQLFTFQLLHASPLHLLINCAMLYIFGRPVEHALGRGHVLKLYFGSGAFGGLFQAACSWAFRNHFGDGPVIGASAGVFGLIAAFATLNRDTPITMLLAFIIPISMKAKYLLLVEAIIALFGILAPPSGIAHAAHLGGMMAGVFYIRQVLHWRWRWPWPARRANRGGQRELVGAGGRRMLETKWSRARTKEDLSAEDFLEKEVDPILDKISANGIQSLTERERRILDAARKKMAGR